jgi:hypothetical protein
MFEEAARLKLRFQTDRGLLTVEDLFELPLTSKTGRPNLDSIAIALDKEIRNTGEAVSFVNPEASSEANKVLNLKFDIVKHIIGVRIAERDAAAAEQKRREDKQKILAVIARKQDQQLEGKPLEELIAMVEQM